MLFFRSLYWSFPHFLLRHASQTVLASVPDRQQEKWRLRGVPCSAPAPRGRRQGSPPRSFEQPVPRVQPAPSPELRPFSSFATWVIRFNSQWQEWEPQFGPQFARAGLRFSGWPPLGPLFGWRKSRSRFAFQCSASLPAVFVD